MKDISNLTEIEIKDLVENLYDYKFFNEDLEDSNLNQNFQLVMFILLRIFWKVMDDLDVDGKGYEIEKINQFDLFQLLSENIEKINLNQNSYRLYFKDLIRIVIYLTKNSK